VERLADYMEKLLKDPAGMAKMKSAGAVLSTADAAGKLADVVESAILRRATHPSRP
jgi:UDP-N-acetylglucosamine:LPS N-acetylglucosamine transferase